MYKLLKLYSKISTPLNSICNNIIYKFSIIVFCLLTSCTTNNMLSFEKINLDSNLNELSGLEFFNKKIITHNDSGNGNSLFVSDINNINFEEIKINNTNNTDWEDICKDNDYLYIADVGNNYGKRKNLKIYKISRKLELVDSINISYALQNNFQNRFKNKFDAEAIISYKDDLIVFSKNRLDKESFLYKIPKNGKHITLNPFDKIIFKSLITGADYSEELDLLALVGYSQDQKDQFIYFIPKFEIPIDKNNVIRIKLPFNNSQIEGVKIISNNLIIISSEDESNSKPFLVKIHIKKGLFSETRKFNIKNK